MIRRLLVVVLLMLALAPRADAATPSVTVAQPVARIGQRVRVSVAGFPVGRAVSVALCGNEGRRGSVDCDLPGSVAFPISRFDREHATPFVLGRPPVPCPCVIQATNAPLGDVAFTPISLGGFPTAPVVGNEFNSPIALRVQIHRATVKPIAWLRSFVGGPTRYVVDVAVHNRTSETVGGVSLTARAGRSASDQARRVVLPAPGALAGGETWRHAQRVTLSAPVMGGFVWSVTASGDNALAKSQVSTNHQPWGLYALLLALVADVGWWGYRRVTRRRRVRGAMPRHAPVPRSS